MCLLSLHQSLFPVLGHTILECIAQAASVVLQPLLCPEHPERLESHKTVPYEQMCKIKQTCIDQVVYQTSCALKIYWQLLADRDFILKTMDLCHFRGIFVSHWSPRSSCSIGWCHAIFPLKRLRDAWRTSKRFARPIILRKSVIFKNLSCSTC